jgi:hypothetical protein
MKKSHRGRVPIAVLVLAATAAAGCARQVVVQSETGGPVGSPQATEDLLRVELQRLAAAQEEYQAANGHYADEVAGLDLQVAEGVRIDIIQGDSAGWSALARAGDSECAIYSGDVRSPRSYVTRPDVVDCRS